MTREEKWLLKQIGKIKRKAIWRDDGYEEHAGQVDRLIVRMTEGFGVSPKNCATIERLTNYDKDSKYDFNFSLDTPESGVL